jgi:hypothetical protein
MRYQVAALYGDATSGARKWVVIHNATSYDALWAWIRKRRHSRRPLPARVCIQESYREPLRRFGFGRLRLTPEKHADGRSARYG